MPDAAIRIATIVLLGSVFATVGAPRASVDARRKTGWFNSAELSVVVTEGNSSTRALGLKDTLRRVWDDSRFRLKLAAVQSSTAEDPYAVVAPEGPPDFAVVRPESESDVERILIEGRYDRTLAKHTFWNVGSSWERNEDAGIRSRSIVFAGVGNRLMDGDATQLDIDYGLSWTERREISPDPESDDSFGGLRFASRFERDLGETTTLGNEWTLNVNLEDPDDFNSDMTQSLGVAINSKVAIKLSLQWLYSNRPALEEVDLFLDPGATVRVGSVDIRKRPTDLVYNTSLVVQF